MDAATLRKVWITRARAGSRQSLPTRFHIEPQLLLKMKVKAMKGRAIRRWPWLPDTAIVGINHNERIDSWHWVVFCRESDSEYVLDPQSKHEIRTDFSRMRLRSCIPVAISQELHPD